MTTAAIRPESGATPTRTEARSAAKATPKKKSRKKLVIAVIAVLAIGGGAYKFAMPKKVGPPTGGDIVTLDPNTVNLASGHYLKITIAIQLVKGKASVGDFKPSEAAELVIDEFSDRSAASLLNNTTRKQLTAELESKIKAAYPGEVYDVFTPQFVTQ
jgi:flagellar FliL protein